MLCGTLGWVLAPGCIKNVQQNQEACMTFSQLTPSGLRTLPLADADHAAWLRLAQGYRDFYQTPTAASEFDLAWRKVLARQEVFGMGAWLDGELVGLCHYLFHASTWAPRVCYLQDLYTAPHVRGRGVARGLIAAVAQQARQGGATRLYWLTQAHNATARALYDRVAVHNGFIRYDHPL
jgi:GNAT superfamily N-acetyltransferase